MPKPRSVEKQSAIIDAAIREFAARGVESTPTSAISAAAGVAEGTLFTYFANKDALINAVYRQLKHELSESILSGYPQAVDARTRFHHLWQRYVHWGIEHSQKFHVLAQLNVSDRITTDSKVQGALALSAIERLVRDSIRKRRVRACPTDYLAAGMSALADTTVAFAARNPHARYDYVEAGFDLFWCGIALP